MMLAVLGVSAGSSRAAEPLKIVVLGDSLTAGFGVGPKAAFPVRLEAALAETGHSATIVNAGVSGDTAANGRDRLDWSIPDGVHGVIVELGANDALRGLDPKLTYQALDDILSRLKQRGVAILLCGMRAPPNLGADYVARFDAIYPDLARKHGVPLYPFFLEGVAADASLNQRDGIHPNEKGVDAIVKQIKPYVIDLLKKAGGGAQ